MGKGEIARYEQFLLFPKCFQKACFPGASKGVIVWEWVNIRKCVRKVNILNIVTSDLKLGKVKILGKGVSLTSKTKKSKDSKTKKYFYLKV